jgi:hypothetical protein
MTGAFYIMIIARVDYDGVEGWCFMCKRASEQATTGGRFGISVSGGR